jgi:hypothetical protein
MIDCLSVAAVSGGGGICERNGLELLQTGVIIVSNTTETCSAMAKCHLEENRLQPLSDRLSSVVEHAAFLR